MTQIIADHQPVAINKRIAKVFEGNCKQRNICPIKDILSDFGDKWSIYTILLLGKHEKRRFTELKNGIDGISQRMLTVTLKSLEQNGIVIRTIYTQVPLRVEYALTELGKTLLERLTDLANWADDHFADIIKARKRYTKKVLR